MDSEKSSRITTLSFVFTCVIVMFHCGSGNVVPVSEIDSTLNSSCNNLFDSMAIVAMGYFFCTSGFLLFVNYRPENYKGKLKKRFITLFVPYVIWNTVTGFVWICKGNLLQYIKTTYLLERWPYDGPLWYMYVAFILSFFAPILYFGFKNEKIGFYILIAFTVALFVMQNSRDAFVVSIINYGIVSNIVNYLPCYLIGVYFGIHDEFKQSKLTIMILTWIILNSFFDGIMKEQMIKLIPILLIYYCPSYFVIKNRTITNLSFLIYAIHTFTGETKETVRIILAKVCEWASFINVVGRILTLCIAIISAFIVWIILGKISPKALKLITGNRVLSELKGLKDNG